MSVKHANIQAQIIQGSIEVPVYQPETRDCPTEEDYNVMQQDVEKQGIVDPIYFVVIDDQPQLVDGNTRYEIYRNLLTQNNWKHPEPKVEEVQSIEEATIKREANMIAKKRDPMKLNVYFAYKYYEGKKKEAEERKKAGKKAESNEKGKPEELLNKEFGTGINAVGYIGRIMELDKEFLYQSIFNRGYTVRITDMQDFLRLTNKQQKERLDYMWSLMNTDKGKNERVREDNNLFVRANSHFKKADTEAAQKTVTSVLGGDEEMEELKKSLLSHPDKGKILGNKFDWEWQDIFPYDVGTIYFDGKLNEYAKEFIANSLLAGWNLDVRIEENIRHPLSELSFTEYVTDKDVVDLANRISNSGEHDIEYLKKFIDGVVENVKKDCLKILGVRVSAEKEKDYFGRIKYPNMLTEAEWEEKESQNG